MKTLEYAEVTWILNSHCKFQCTYCSAEFRSGGLDRPISQYLTVVEKLQNTRYQHCSKIYWKLGGGEPLHFPHLDLLLKKIKEKPSLVRLDTSGDDSWFSFYSVLRLVDSVKITYHPWQNDDVFDFILEQCQENAIAVAIVVPLAPGLIVESREKVRLFTQLGYNCSEKILTDLDGELHRGYSQLDLNRIYGRPDNYIPNPIKLDPNKPHPRYVDLSVINDIDPVYTGMPCYAGVDWLYIGPRGFVSYSLCGGRNEHYNAFDTNWQPPNDYFHCTVNQCRNKKDRDRIRIISS